MKVKVLAPEQPDFELTVSYAEALVIQALAGHMSVDTFKERCGWYPAAIKVMETAKDEEGDGPIYSIYRALSKALNGVR